MILVLIEYKETIYLVLKPLYGQCQKHKQALRYTLSILNLLFEEIIFPILFRKNYKLKPISLKHRPADPRGLGRLIHRTTHSGFELIFTTYFYRINKMYFCFLKVFFKTSIIINTQYTVYVHRIYEYTVYVIVLYCFITID